MVDSLTEWGEMSCLALDCVHSKNEFVYVFPRETGLLRFAGRCFELKIPNENKLHILPRFSFKLILPCCQNRMTSFSHTVDTIVWVRKCVILREERNSREWDVNATMLILKHASLDQWLVH